MKDRKSVRVSRGEDDKTGLLYEWEITDPLDNPETTALAEEMRKVRAKILGPAITKHIERVFKINWLRVLQTLLTSCRICCNSFSRFTSPCFP